MAFDSALSRAQAHAASVSAMPDGQTRDVPFRLRDRLALALEGAAVAGGGETGGGKTGGGETDGAHNGASAARGPRLALLLRELTFLLGPVPQLVRDALNPAPLAPAAEPATIMLLPGFLADPRSMRYLARRLEEAGHTVKRWGQGTNMGVSAHRLSLAEDRVADLHHRYGRKVWLIGWSLGGLYARELAKRQADCVAGVITMGSPFSGDVRANNAWRIYQFVAGHRVDAVPVDADLARKPPVPTIALWSARDGVISPRSACGRPGERDRAVALRCSHMDFAYSDAALGAIVEEIGRGNRAH